MNFIVPKISTQNRESNHDFTVIIENIKSYKNIYILFIRFQRVILVKILYEPLSIGLKSELTSK